MKGCTSFLIVLTISSFALQSTAQSNKYFTGTITYQLEVFDSTQNQFLATQSTSILIIDSIYVRSENESKLGLQILIKDIEADTATLLMTALGTDYALSMDFKDGDKKADNKVEYQKKGKKKEFSGYQGRLYTYTKNKKGFEAYMTDEIDGRYIGVLNDLDGFPLQYSLGFGPQIIRYTCVGISPVQPSPELFQAPEGYKRMTLDEFYESIQGQN